MSKAGQGQLGALLQILKESLEQKLDILGAIEGKSKEQAEMLSETEVVLQDIDRNMDEKAGLIERITKLDSGFEALYDNIREVLQDNKDSYKKEIADIQNLICMVMEKSASIEALEKRNKAAIETYFSDRKKELQHRKTASSVVQQYYKAANKLNVINPQFLDKKK